MFESWVMDFRYAARRLMRRPTYALLAVLTLALGAGGTAAIFSVVRTLLLDPLPITREDQVGILWFGGSWNEQEFLHLRPNFTGFQRMAAWRPNDSTLETPGGPMRLVEGVASSSEFFDVLGAAADAGPHLPVRRRRTGLRAGRRPEPRVMAGSRLRSSIVGRPIQFGGVTTHRHRGDAARLLVPQPDDENLDRRTTRPAEQGRQVLTRGTHRRRDVPGPHGRTARRPHIRTRGPFPVPAAVGQDAGRRRSPGARVPRRRRPSKPRSNSGGDGVCSS